MCRHEDLLDVAARSWIADDGEDLLCLHLDYQDSSFRSVSGSVVVFTGRGSLCTASEEKFSY